MVERSGVDLDRVKDEETDSSTVVVETDSDMGTVSVEVSVEAGSIVVKTDSSSEDLVESDVGEITLETDVGEVTLGTDSDGEEDERDPDWLPFEVEAMYSFCDSSVDPNGDGD